MLIWMKTPLGDMGVEHGVLRAHEVQELHRLDAARSELARRTDALLEEARGKAARIVAEAEAEAGRLLDAAAAQVEAARSKGYDEGVQRAVNEWHERQAGHAVQKARALSATHEKLAEIVTTAVERIVQTEPRGALYQRALRSVQTLTRGASSLTLRVNPADHADASEAIASLPDLQESGLPVEVKADASLRAGSCIFESDLGVLDASLHTQLDGLRQAMARAVRRAIVDDDALPESDDDDSDAAASSDSQVAA